MRTYDLEHSGERIGRFLKKVNRLNCRLPKSTKTKLHSDTSNTTMNELKSSGLKRPMDPMLRGNDAATLNALCRDLNNPLLTGAEVPSGVQVQIPVTPLSPAPVDVPSPVLPTVEAPAPTAPPAERITRLAFTGALKSGKDYVAEQAGAKIFGFADPMYALLDHFFGTRDKDANGARQFLQKVGQWGRGLVDADHPLTTERAIFVERMQHFEGSPDLHVRWTQFGKDPDIWMNALLKRVADFLIPNPDARVAVSNVRFDNEKIGLKDAGWSMWHVMCSPETWLARITASGLAREVQKNGSERLAATTNQDVLKRLSAQRVGPRLRCIWNDERVPCPSPRLFTVPEFLAHIR